MINTESGWWKKSQRGRFIAPVSTRFCLCLWVLGSMGQGRGRSSCVNWGAAPPWPPLQTPIEGQLWRSLTDGSTLGDGIEIGQESLAGDKKK